MADNKTFIEEFTKPSEVIGSTIADKKSQIITAKPELLNIGDESAYKSFQELYENSNWNIQRTKMVRNISLLGGTCLFLNELNNDWQILQTNNITYVIKDAAGNEEAITLFVNLIKGNTGNYWLYQTHTKDKICRTVRKQKENVTRETAYTSQPEYPWASFLIDTNINLKQEIKTGTMTAFFVQNMEPLDEGIFSYADTTKAKAQIQLLDLAWESLVYNLRAARVRIVINNAQGVGEDSVEDASRQGDKFLLGGALLITQNTTLPDNNPISMAEPNPQIISESWKSYGKAVMEVFERVNLAKPDDEDGAQKSQFEVAQIRDSEFSGMEKLISLIQVTYHKIMKAYAHIKNLNIGEEFGWEIQRLDVQSEIELLNNLEKMLSMGLITIQDAIAQARKIEPAAAEVEYQKIKKQKEEQQEKQKELINDTQEKLPQEEEIDNAKNG